MSILDTASLGHGSRARTVALAQLSSADLDGLYRRDLKAYSITSSTSGARLRRFTVADGILADMMASVSEAYVKQRA